MRIIDADALIKSIESDRNCSDMPSQWIDGVNYAIDLIELYALMCKVNDSFKSAGLHEEDFRKFKRWVNKAPTIDAVSVVHGEWIFRREFVEDTPFTGYRCSNCNYWQGMGAWNFCPNCGAKMKGADDE